MSPDTDWLRDERSSAARDKLLTIAEELFFRQGVAGVTMRQIADAAGCSRATLYRYFPGRADLHLAYIDRSTRVIARTIEDTTGEIDDPADRLTAAVVVAVAGVRTNPALMAWFAPDSAATTGALAMSSEMIAAVTSRFVELLGGSGDARDVEWVVRIVVSFLIVPVPESDMEHLVRRYLVPVIISAEPVRRGPGHRRPL
ncbi:TetR/AcrR family transcriptional regulator [Williamsia maris]|uniref:Transcriptional regulator, TetR family n=1 Tax=Williamsia maris TaxID=72806 RepID=A0ABT1HET9_9NOCA|nr:TetR/AcrR family transcriptional regulator [Williamsia maris]MCP2176752.1 transcriptional regulator, TetR family [Williamsia maris]